MFAAVREQLRENQRHARQSRRGALYLLQGLVQCQQCGYAYYGKRISPRARKGKPRAYAYYRCLGTDAYRFGGERVCQNTQVRTDRLDLAAELVALGYKYRWWVELFFRWLKCILGCRHLLSTSPGGVTIQVYLALIASLLVSLWTGHRPNKRTFEMLCFYFSGWASAEELQAHIEKLQQKSGDTS